MAKKEKYVSTLLSYVLTVCLITGAVPATTFAQDSTQVTQATTKKKKTVQMTEAKKPESKKTMQVTDVKTQKTEEVEIEKPKKEEKPTETQPVTTTQPTTTQTLTQEQQIATINEIEQPMPLDATAHDKVCNDDHTGWTALDEDIVKTPLPNGNYYLMSNFVLSKTLEIKGDNVVLCLNGKTLKLSENANSDSSVIQLNRDAQLTLFDNADNKGIITGAKKHGIYESYDSTLKMYGGTITKNSAYGTRGGGVYVYHSRFYMYDGIIIDNAAYSGGGVGVYYDARFIMYGGTITENSATESGGVFVEGTNTFSAGFTMHDGKIINNSAKNGGNIGGVRITTNAGFIMNGGEISNNNGIGVSTVGTFTMNGGEISNNNGRGVSTAGNFTMNDGTITNNSDGGVFVGSSGKFNVSKTPKIIGNFTSQNTKTTNDNNVKLATGATINVTAELQEEATIGVNLYEPPISENPRKIVESSNGYIITNSDKEKFSSDDKSYEILFENNTLYLQKGVTPPPDETSNFTVTFDSKDGSTVASQSIANGGKVTEPTAPTKNGFTFDGWYKEAACTTAWNFATDIVTKDITLYAKWTPDGSTTPTPPDDTNPTDKFTVTFDSQGGSAITSQSIAKDGKATKPVDPTKDGYTFDGWYKEVACTTAWNFATDTVTENITLYAKWNDESPTPPTIAEHIKVCNNDHTGWTVLTEDIAKNPLTEGNYYLTNNLTLDEELAIFGDVTLCLNGKTLEATLKTPSNLPVIVINGEGAVLTLFDVANNSGKITGGTGSGVSVCEGSTFTMNGGTISNNSSHFYGGGVNVTGTFTMNGGSISDNSADLGGGVFNSGTFTICGTARITGNRSTSSDANNNVYLDADKIINVIGELGQDTAIGFTLSDTQKKGSQRIIAEGDPLIVDDLAKFISDEGYTILFEDHTIYIRTGDSTTSSKFTVTFDSQGGSAVANQSIANGEKATKPADPTKDGFTFDGWYKEATCTTAWNFATDTVIENITLYAKWTEKKTEQPSKPSEPSRPTQPTRPVTPTPTNYTVTFDTNGGSEIASETVESGKAAMMPENPTRSGYTFLGWFADKEFNEIYRFSTPVTSDITIYAKWKKKSSSSGGGGGGSSSSGGSSSKDEGRTGTWVTEEPKTSQVATQPVVQPISQPTTQYQVTNPSCPRNETCPLSKFTDVDKWAWYHDGSHYCVENNLIVGTGNTTFSPNMPITRGMVVAILWRMEDKPLVNDVITFQDVKETAYYAEAVRWAAHNEIVSGYSNTKFAPNDDITREQMASILYRYTQYKGNDISGRADISKYEDANEISKYAIEAMQWACDTGIINGISATALSPKGTTTRAQAAQMFYMYLKK